MLAEMCVEGKIQELVSLKKKKKNNEMTNYAAVTL